jgi:hypothetical protein
MRMLTRNFIEEAWREMAVNDRAWSCYEQYEVDMEEAIGDVDASADATYLTKIDSEEAWSVSNIKLVNVTSDYDWNEIQVGAIKYGGMYQ